MNRSDNGSPVRVIQMGLGPIGQKVVTYLAERDNIDLVGAIDIDPDKIGRDVGTLCDIDALGIAVSGDVEDTLKVDADIVLLTTGSALAQVASQVEQCVKAGKHVVSTCKELAYPFDGDADLVGRVDQAARDNHVVVLGTGVNPGFLMDALPIFLSSVCQRVDTVKIERFQDASIRRLPFQQKIGAGLSPDEFEQKRQAGTIRHVGFEQSIRMIAAAMGWKLDRVDDEVFPVIAECATSSPFIPGPARPVRWTAPTRPGPRERSGPHCPRAAGLPGPPRAARHRHHPRRSGDPLQHRGRRQRRHRYLLHCPQRPRGCRRRCPWPAQHE